MNDGAKKNVCLMHAITDYQRLHFLDKNRAKAASGDSSATRKLANYRWYQEHKAEKQRYNKQYYQQHKEYWQQQYHSAHKMSKLHDKWAEERKSQLDEAQKKYGKNSKEYKRAKESYDFQVNASKEMAAERTAAKMNLQRSMKEYDNYMKDKMQSKITKMWSDGVSQIKDAGRKFVNNIKVTGIYLNARQKYWDWRNGR